MGRGAAWLVLLVAACYRPVVSEDVPCGAGSACPIGQHCGADGVCRSGASADGAVDTSPAVGDGDRTPQCYGTADAMVCLAPPMAPIDIAQDTSIDTGGTMCVPYQSPQGLDACVVAGTTVHVEAGATLSALGARPLVLIGTGAIAIDGAIDVASHRAGRAGPGSDPPSCVVAAGAGTTGGGGGAGGSFGGRGGNGGQGTGGNGGASSPASPIAGLAGGCEGGPGGGPGAGQGGAGGGAVMLASMTSIEVTGSIDASGAAGAGGAHAGSAGGGGGGGAGGLIVLEAPSVMVDSGARVFANGGGGGEGADASNDGKPGGESAGPQQAGAGGTGGTANAGDGGAGAAGPKAAGVAGGNGAMLFGGAAGGGGGGGVGAIRVEAASAIGTTDATLVWPPPS